jgi:hypothetical protein
MTARMGVKAALQDFESASNKLRLAYKPFDDGKIQDPNQVAVATAAPLVFVEEAKARLEVALALDRDRSSKRTSCAMLVFTLGILLATAVQACLALKGCDLARTSKPNGSETRP